MTTLITRSGCLTASDNPSGWRALIRVLFAFFQLTCLHYDRENNVSSSGSHPSVIFEGFYF